MIKISRFIHWWNYAPIWKIVLITVIPIILWFVVVFKCSKRRTRNMGFVLFTCSALAILYITLFSREKGSESAAVLIPFSFVYRGLASPTIYRSFWMNVYLFVPIGLAIGAIKKKNSISILFALCLSTVIEITQFGFKLGTLEVDDIIANTIGCLLGAWMSTLAIKLKCSNKTRDSSR